MIHSIHEIIENQKKFSSKIISWLIYDFQKEVKKLDDFKYKDDTVIIQEVEKLKSKISKLKPKVFYKSLLFISGPSKRNKKYYAMWDENIEETIIYRYDQKKRVD